MRWRRTFTGLHVAALAWLALQTAGCTEEPRPGLQPGDKLPPFTLAGLTAAPVDSESLAARIALVNVWATWCGPCRAEMPSLQRLSESLDPGRYRVVGIAVDTDANLVREFALRHGISFPLALDPGGAVTRGWLGPLVIPETLLIGADGRVVERVRGSMDWDTVEWRERVMALAGSQEPGARGRSGPPDLIAGPAAEQAGRSAAHPTDTDSLYGAQR